MRPYSRLRFPSLVCLAALCLTAVLIRTKDVAPQPIAWVAFSEERAEELLSKGRTVLLYCQPTYHPASEAIDETLLNPEITRLFDKTGFVPMQHTYRNWDGEITRKLLKKHGHTKGPMMFVYRPNGVIEPFPIRMQSMRVALESELSN